MGEQAIFSRSLLIAALLGALALFPASRLAAENASPDDILALQRRLADAGCYKGAFDGAPSAALNEAIKACPDQRPTLRIETGMHTAAIGQIDVDAACRLIATGSEDKTVRLWSLPQGKLERVIRLPIGFGDGGKLYATAISPDGRFVAAGGLDAAYEKTRTYSVAIVDLQTNAAPRYGAYEDIPYAAAFSPDGSRVAVGLGGRSGVRVLDRATGAELLADHDYGVGAYALAFSPDGSLIASGFDGRLRRYGPDLRLTATRAAPGGRLPYGVAVDPAGRRVAVGYSDTDHVSVLDAVTLAPIADAGSRDTPGGKFFKVAWSPDGATFFAGGATPVAAGEGQWINIIRRFTRDGRRLGADIPASSDTIQGIRPCGAGLAFASAEPGFGLLSADGQAKTLQGTRKADMRGKLGSAFTLSADAATVRFGLGQREVNPVLFDLAAASLVESPGAPAGLSQPRVGPLPNSVKPLFDNSSGETARAYAIRSDGAGFALGADLLVHAFDAAGRQLWQRPGPSVAWGVNLSADGEIIVIAYADGTIRWLRWSDGAELLAFFVDAPTRKWVAWTPTGYYMASPGGEDLIGWHINRGWNQLADFFPASRFSARFNRPDIVQLVLKTHDEAAAIAQADETSKRKLDARTIAAALPPVVRIVSPAPGSQFSGDAVEVTFNLRSPSGLAVDRVDMLIDGRPIEQRGFVRAQAAPQQLGLGEGETRTLTVPAPQRDFELSLIARSGAVVGEAAKLRLVYAGAASGEPTAALKPKLYAVTIGVSAYADPDLRLDYAAADAQGFAEALQHQKGGLYGDVVVKTLVDKEATRESVLDALDWLEKQVTSRDLGVVMLAGHGVTDDKQRFWFLPADASPDHLRTSAISQDEIQSTMSGLAGKAILFLDSCHANQIVANTGGPKARGLVDMNSIVNELARTENGVVVFASSLGRETSQESAAWRHGAFTKALIEGLDEGKADLLHKGAITVSALDAYVTDRVKDLTDQHQHAVMSRPNTVPDFAFAVAR